MFAPGNPSVFYRCSAVTLTGVQYSKKYLEELLPHCTIVPAVNQIENHPALPQQEIVDFCKEKGIHIVAYSPLGSTGGPLMTAEPVVKIAEKRKISASAVLLSYHGKFITRFAKLEMIVFANADVSPSCSQINRLS
jgi:diketogulonate reductase-like aldo/keto reductase